jgi:hypothetical protein
MQADYLRYIIECFHGDNGIFSASELVSMEDDFSYKEKSSRTYRNYKLEEITIDCDIGKLEEESSDRMTLLDYLEHECYHHYEKAKLCFIDTFKQPVKFKDISTQ